MTSETSDQPDFKSLGIVSKGEFKDLLQLAVDHNLYGTLTLIAEDITTLTFIDGYVVTESGEISNRALDRERMSAMLQKLLDGDGFVGRYRFEVLSGRQAVHEAPRFNPIALAGARRVVAKPVKKPAAAPAATKSTFDTANLGTSKAEHLLTPTVEAVMAAEPAAEQRRHNDPLFDSLRKLPDPVSQTRQVGAERPTPRQGANSRDGADAGSAQVKVERRRTKKTAGSAPATPADAARSTDAVESVSADSNPEPSRKPNRRTALRRLIRTLSS